MKTVDLMRVEGWECLQADAPEGPILAGYTSDLLSDVIAHAPADSVLITIQAHVNTVAVAVLAGIRAILICHRRPVPEAMLAAAQRENVLLLRTADNQFISSVRLHALLQDAPP